MLQKTATMALLLAIAATAQAQKEPQKDNAIADQTLREVRVTGRRSTIRLKVDRKEIDVENTITADGQSASEVLASLPSVDVDNDGNVSLRGSRSVTVWINGKASGLTGETRAQILQQLPAESIKRIEIIDAPPAQFPAEGSAGIINIVLKKNRKGGHFGSVKAGGNTKGEANASLSVNYNHQRWETYLNVGYRHREDIVRNEIVQDNTADGVAQTYERHFTRAHHYGNTFFARAGMTWYATKHDELTVDGTLYSGENKQLSSTPYYYGDYTAEGERLSCVRWRDVYVANPMIMYSLSADYRHTFAEQRFLNLRLSYDRFCSEQDNIYHDSLSYGQLRRQAVTPYESRPFSMRSHKTEAKLDYSNRLSSALRVQAGYHFYQSHERMPQTAYVSRHWSGANAAEDAAEYNNYSYRKAVHALYGSMTYDNGRFGIMGGLRAEYWRTEALSLDYDEDHGLTAHHAAAEREDFQLFPSLFLTYHLTASNQLQLSYTRRLRRPGSADLNDFRNKSDAATVQFGNPDLMPEYAQSVTMNYLTQWRRSSLLVSAYYRPTSDVIHRINYRDDATQMIYRTPLNVATSTAWGCETVYKTSLGRRLSLTASVNAYYNKTDAYDCPIAGQVVHNDAQENFTWTVYGMMQYTMPYGINLEASGRYYSRRLIMQGHRPPFYGVDMGASKKFLNNSLVVTLNVIDILNSKRYEAYTSSDSFQRYHLNKYGNFRVNLTLTYRFGKRNDDARHRNNLPNDVAEPASTVDEQQ